MDVLTRVLHVDVSFRFVNKGISPAEWNLSAALTCGIHIIGVISPLELRPKGLLRTIRVVREGV